MPNIYYEIFYSAASITNFLTPLYYEIKAYAESCVISKTKHFVKNPL